MLKFIIKVILTFAIAVNLIGCNSSVKEDYINSRGEEMPNINVGDLINFQLYKSYKVDTNGLRKNLNVVDGTPFLFFLQVYNLDTWKTIGEFQGANFKFPEFDFESDDYKDKYLAVSFGRKVTEIVIIGEINYGQLEVAITFDDEYHDDIMFLYIMDKIPLRDGLASEYYVTSGLEKIFLGRSILDLNEWVLE